MYKQINERGFSKVQIIIAIVVAAVIAAGGFYLFSKKSDDGSPQGPLTSENKSIEAACMSTVNDSDYCRFASRWSMNDDFVMTMTSPEDDSVLVTRSNADGTHTIMSEHGSVVSEIISLKGANYMKNVDDGTWQKFGGDDEDSDYSSDHFIPEIDFEEDALDGQTITKLGKEACGNLTCFKYELIDTTEDGSTTNLWFDDKDYKLRRLTSEDSSGQVEATFSYEKVSISEPSPIVEAPSFEGADFNIDDIDMDLEEMQRQLQQLQ